MGILKARATRLLKRGQLATYGKFFHGVSISRETEEFVDIEISDEDELKIIDLSKSPYIIEKIRDSLAPSIYGHDLVKEAIASLRWCQPSAIKAREFTFLPAQIENWANPSLRKTEMTKTIIAI